MRKTALMLLLAVLSGCVADYGRLGLDSLGQVRVESVSLTSMRLAVTADVRNSSGRDLPVCGVVLTSPDAEGISLRMDSAVVVKRGGSRMELPVVLQYDPVSVLALAGKMKEGVRIDILVELPHRKIKLKRKTDGASLASFIEKFWK